MHQQASLMQENQITDFLEKCQKYLPEKVSTNIKKWEYGVE